MTAFAPGLVAVSTFVAVEAASWVALDRRRPRRDRLAQSLLPYVHRAAPRAEPHALTLAETAVMKRAVAATGRFAARQRVLPKIEGLIERADLPLRPEEAAFFSVAVAAALGLLALVISRSVLAAAGVSVVALAGLVAAARHRAGRRRRLFLAQLPDALRMLAASLRSGYSLGQGMQAVVEEAPNPLGNELRRVVNEARLGRSIEDGMRDVALRMDSGDCEFAASAIRIQREVGGNLAELLASAAQTIVTRERLRNEMRALTAEGRMSAIILGLLPLGMALVFYILDPAYLGVLFHDSVGQMMLAVSAALAAIGFLWMKKMLDVRV